MTVSGQEAGRPVGGETSSRILFGHPILLFIVDRLQEEKNFCKTPTNLQTLKTYPIRSLIVEGSCIAGANDAQPLLLALLQHRLRPIANDEAHNGRILAVRFGIVESVGDRSITQFAIDQHVPVDGVLTPEGLIVVDNALDHTAHGELLDHLIVHGRQWGLVVDLHLQWDGHGVDHVLAMVRTPVQCLYGNLLSFLRLSFTSVQTSNVHHGRLEANTPLGKLFVHPLAHLLSSADDLALLCSIRYVVHHFQPFTLLGEPEGPEEGTLVGFARRATSYVQGNEILCLLGPALTGQPLGEGYSVPLRGFRRLPGLVQRDLVGHLLEHRQRVLDVPFGQ